MRLGHVLRFRHTFSKVSCPAVSRSEIITVLHTNGFHKFKAEFCGCATSTNDIFERGQMMDARLFPVSTTSPNTAITFACLDLLSQLNSQAKLSNFNFYQAMCQLTDNAELSDSYNVSYTYFCSCFSLIDFIPTRKDTMNYLTLYTSGVIYIC